MSYGGYGDGGGGGGGGYQTTNYAGGGNGFFTGSQGGGGSQGSPSKELRKNTLRPVTIKQILEATQPSAEGTYHIDDQEVALVTFVAQIRNVVEQTINNTYRMDDGTGQLEVKQWIDSDKPPPTGDADTQSQLVENAYVRVLGSLKGYQGKRTIASHMIRPVTDFNEVQYHMLEATAVHLLFTRGPPPEAGSGGGMGGGQNQTGGYGAKEEYGGDTGMGGMGGGGGGGGASNLPSNTTPNAKKVWTTIRTRGGSNEGLHVNAIAQASGLQMQAVYSAVEELLGFGVVYTTVDDEHIACMDF